MTKTPREILADADRVRGRAERAKEVWELLVSIDQPYITIDSVNGTPQRTRLTPEDDDIVTAMQNAVAALVEELAAEADALEAKVVVR